MLILLLIFIVADFRLNKKIFTPAIIFNGIFFVTLFLYYLNLSYIQQPLSADTKGCLWLSVLAYNFVVFVYYLTHAKIRKDDFVHFNDFYTFGISNDALFIARLVVLVVFFAEVVYSRGFPLMWKLTGSSLTYFDFGIPSVNGAFCGLVMILGAYTLTQKGVDKYIYIGIGVLIISRQVIVSIVIEGLVFKLITSRKKIKRLFLKLFALAVVGITAFAIIGNFRTGTEDFLKVGQFKPEYDYIPVSVKWIYSYMCFSLSNFDNLVSMTGGFENFGASSLNELFPSVLTDFLHIKQNAEYYYLISPNFTASTCYPEIYLDFGMFGIALHCFLIALIAVWSFENFTKNGNVKYAMIYAVIVHNILMFFFNNMFLYLPVVSQFVYAALLFSKRRTVDANRLSERL